MSKNELIASLASLASLKDLPLETVDSVYLGNPYCLLIAGNLISNTKDLVSAIEIVKNAGKKAYLTTPVISFSDDFDDVVDAINVAVRAGIDAIEVHDVGTFNFLRRELPEMKIHMGHFINIYNEEVGKLYLELGASRIIPSYELTLSEKTEFVKLGMEIEIPIHGHLPIGMAQACLLAMELPSRDPVRCVQQCRTKSELVLQGWKMRCTGKAMVMAENLTMIEYLKLLLDSGFSKFRMDMLYNDSRKMPEIARIYRSALDEATSSASFDAKLYLSKLSELLNGEICNGWYFGASGRLYLGDEERVELENYVTETIWEEQQKRTSI